jgi:hypothetical protein
LQLPAAAADRRPIAAACATIRVNVAPRARRSIVSDARFRHSVGTFFRAGITRGQIYDTNSRPFDDVRQPRGWIGRLPIGAALGLVEAVGEIVRGHCRGSEFGSTEIAVDKRYAASGCIHRSAAGRVAVVDESSQHRQHAFLASAGRATSLTGNDCECTAGNLSKHRRAANHRNSTVNRRVD